jgi:hypothetical protein
MTDQTEDQYSEDEFGANEEYTESDYEVFTYDDFGAEELASLPMIQGDESRFEWNRNFTVNRQDQWFKFGQTYAARPGIPIGVFINAAEDLFILEHTVSTDKIAAAIDAQRQSAVEPTQQEKEVK